MKCVSYEIKHSLLQIVTYADTIYYENAQAWLFCYISAYYIKACYSSKDSNIPELLLYTAEKW